MPDSLHQQVGTTSTSLIFRLKEPRRDEAAWERLIALYSRLVLYWCKKSGVPKDDRYDVLQEIFTAVGKGISRFQWGEPGLTFRGWLRTIARSKIVDKYRDNEKQPQLFSDTHLEELAAKLVDKTRELDVDDETERVLLLKQAMEIVRQDVEPKTWEAFRLTAMESMDSIAAAAELGTSAANVRQAKKRVFDRLKNEFGEMLD